MLNSSTTLSSNNPIFFPDNDIASYYPSDDITNPYSNFPLLSPPIYNELTYLDYNYNFPSNQELALIQQMVESKTNSSIVTEESASVLEETTANKMDASKKDGGIHGIMDGIATYKAIGTKEAAAHGLKRRRTSNRDRHSKIQTAHGLRDRRMRLSLEVARQFFRLQDILGYDKASRTIEWLLMQSKPAIEGLIQGKFGSLSGVTKCTISCTSDCEVESTEVEQKKTDSKGKKASNLVGKTINTNTNDKCKQQRRVMISKEARKAKRENARVKTLERKRKRGLIQDCEKSSFFNHLDFGAYEVIEKYNDLHLTSHKGNSELPLGIREDHGDGSLNGVWNPLPTLSYNQNDGATNGRRSNLSLLNF